MGSETLQWLTPTLAAMFLWGVAQGLVKKYIGEVPPARFCLFYAFANAAVGLAFWAFNDAPPVFAQENRQFAVWGLFAYALDGAAWIFYYQSIVHGPISIVGTLSAAYPALTVILARAFLGERLLAAIAYKKGPASIVPPLSGAYPVVTLAFAWAFLHERPSALQWAGIALVLLGMVLTTAGA